ncbi:MAG: phosphatidate cytidylyltransferase, partial [candidate division Zixibacteria bacterium]|nr:phosphatidate cytidylyltransferase [candidate division Zixibacteria bacterium]
AIFIPIIFVLVLIGNIPFLVFIELLVVAGIFEFCKIVEVKEISLPKLAFVLIGMIFPICSYFLRGMGFLSLIVMSFVVIALLLVLAGKVERGIGKISSFVFGTIYIPLGFSFLILIRQLPFWYGENYKMGALWIIFVLLSIWSCDTFAYFVGVAIGKHPLSSQISPKKTWEGAIAGFLGAILVAPLCYFVFFKEAPLAHLLVISVIIGIFGQIGDLLESLLKRDANVKDASKLIPGHGGVLDRFDSLLFVSPIIYIYLSWVVYG